MKKKRETLKSLRQQLKWLQRDMNHVRNRAHADGYNEGRRVVTNALRDLLGIDPL